jgi:hypothetical protein
MKLKISLEEELRKERQSTMENPLFNPVEEVKQLLLAESSEDTRILRNLSDNAGFNRVERAQGIKMELESLEDRYHGDVYTIGQIEKLAIDYRLRFLRSKYFTGTYDVEVTGKIKEFAKKANIEMTDYIVSNTFYVLAPQEMFALENERYVTKAELRDPVLFYRIDQNHYRLIHKWGNDFSPLRYLEGFRWKSYPQYWLFNTALILPFMCLLMILLTSHYFPLNYPVWFGATALVLSTALAYFIYGYNKADEGSAIREYFSPGNWDRHTKITR